MFSFGDGDAAERERVAVVDLNPGDNGVVFPSPAQAGLVLAAGIASEALSMVFPWVGFSCEPGRAAGKREEQPSVPQGCRGLCQGC